ncbi:MAG: cytochrome c biogenesis protein CcdA, partial [Chloroflexota bacterium]
MTSVWPAGNPVLAVSFLGAFAGGVLSLLAPCSALLLPAFFAYAFSSRAALLRHTLLFYLGLCTLLVPLGMGASLVSVALIGYRDATVVIAGLVVIGFGVLEITGRGFALLPARFTGAMRPGAGAAASIGAGMVYGLAGFCADPLLGDVLLGGALLATYALGTAAPLFGLAWCWDRWDMGSRPWLRGREVRLGTLRVHSTNLIAGTLFILLGAGLIAFQGGSALSGLYADFGFNEIGLVAQTWLADLELGRGADLAVLTLLALAATAAAVRRLARTRRAAALPANDGGANDGG